MGFFEAGRHMRITWHKHENALHFLMMDRPVAARRALSPGIVELLDSDGRLVRADVLDVPGILSAAYHSREDWLDIHLREGEFSSCCTWCRRCL